MLNPYNIGYLGIVAFVIGTIACIAIGIAGGLAAMWHHREKRDGKR